MIKPASLEQAPLLAVLHAESFGEAAWSHEQIHGSLALDTTKGWLAYSGDKPVGFILLQTMPEQAEILTFCVAPSYQRQKIGEKLLQHAIAATRNNGCKKIFLEVAADNLAACKLYEKSGFRLIGKRPNYYKHGDKPVDACIYELLIS